MNKPNFTVVIPLFNKEKHILRTLKSIENQHYQAAEIIVVDDGSTDNSAAVVEQAQIKNLRLVRQKNAGVSSARNHGIMLANHPYVAFIDADDQWLPLYLQETANLIERFPHAEVFGTRYQIVEGNEHYVDAKIHLGNIDPQGIVLQDYFDIASQGDLPFTMSSVTFKKSLFGQIGLFPTGEPIGEDQDLFCRAALNSQIAYSNNIHSLYHRDATNRACIDNVPSTECPFSQRLTEHASRLARQHGKQVSMLRYSAAHLCHIAKINIGVGRCRQARALLSDPRCRLKPKHWLGLYLLSWVEQAMGYARKLAS